MSTNDINEDAMEKMTIPFEGELNEGPGKGGSGAPPADKVKKTFLRESGGITDIFLIAALLFFLLMLLGEFISNAVNTLLPVHDLGMRLAGDEDIVEFLIMYFNFYGIWIAFILVIIFFKGNWPMWKAFLYNKHGNNFKAVLAGILLGGGMNGFCILMSYLQGDIRLTYNGFDPKLFFLFLFCVFIQSGAEEILERCYLYQKLRRRYRWPAFAILVNSLLFMALHIANPGVTKLGLLQVFLIGLLFSLIVYYFDSLWTVIWAHTAWNFSQSIVFGLPNSGIVSKYSLFKLDAASATDGIFYNTSFGVEGSLGANVLVGAAILIVLIIGLVSGKGEKKDHWKETEERGHEKKSVWESILIVIFFLLVAGSFGLLIYDRMNSEEYRKMMEEYENQISGTASGKGTETVTEMEPLRILILPQYEEGDMTGDIPGEAQYYYEAYLEGGEAYDIQGDADGCMLYVKDGIALYVTGQGKLNAALNTQALLSDARFDFSHAYILVTGSALSAARYGVPGDVFVITSAVDYDLGIHTGSEAEGEDGSSWIHDPADDDKAVFTLNADLADRCYELIRKLNPQTTDKTRAYMKEGFDNKKWTRRRPQVLKGTSVSGSSCGKGAEVHANALLMTEAYGCGDPYAALAPEDAAIGQVLKRMDLLDRMIILRTGIDTDLYAKGETTKEEGSEDAASAKSLKGAADIYETAMKNGFEAGKILIDAFVSGEGAADPDQ